MTHSAEERGRGGAPTKGSSAKRGGGRRRKKRNIWQNRNLGLDWRGWGGRGGDGDGACWKCLLAPSKLTFFLRLIRRREEAIRLPPSRGSPQSLRVATTSSERGRGRGGRGGGWSGAGEGVASMWF